jgi:hypothetical protein
MTSGRWSAAVSNYFDLLIRSQGLTRDKVANGTGIAESRFSALLNKNKGWYLEDVDILCTYFNLDVVDLLSKLEVDALPPALPNKESPPFEYRADAGAA